LADFSEKEFHRDGFKIAFAQEEELSKFSGVDSRNFLVETLDGIYFRCPTIENYLSIYQKSLEDGYRTSKGKTDSEKIRLIKIKLKH
jgi:hypothetical protein